MFLKPHQMYLENQTLYDQVCRLARVRVQQLALRAEEASLERAIRDAMCPATELVDMAFLRTQRKVSEAERAQMFLARWTDTGLVVHPCFASTVYRPGSGDRDDVWESDGTDGATAAGTQDEIAPCTPPPAPGPKEACRAGAEIDKDTRSVRDARERLAFMEFFNRTVAARRIPPIRSLEGSRWDAVQARRRQHGDEALAAVVRQAANDPELCGEGATRRAVGFDWLFRPNNFARVLAAASSQTAPREPMPAGNIRPAGSPAAEPDGTKHTELNSREDAA